MLRTGSPTSSRTKSGEPLEFLNNTVLKYQGDECLIWPFGRTTAGYALLHSGDKAEYVHRLACEHLHGPAPSLKHDAAHSCGKGDEGCVNPQHLRWATRKENNADKVQHGTHNRGVRHGMCILTETDVLTIRRLSGEVSQYKIAEMFGVSRGNIASIIQRKSWKWLD